MYVKSGDQYESRTTINVEINDKKNGEQVFTKLYGMPSSMNDTTGNNRDQKLIGQLNFSLNPGDYIIRVTGADAIDTSNFITIEREVSLANNDLNVSMSDIQLSSQLTKSENKSSSFYKNTLEVVPNPELLFGNNLKRVYYYYEIYKLKSSGISGNVELVASIRDLNNKELMKLKKEISTGSESIADYGMFIIDSLPSASYILNVTVSDLSGGVIVSKEKKFFVYNSNISQDISLTKTGDDFMMSEYAKMREELVDADFELALYLRDMNETNTYNKLSSVDEKRRFMFNFWKRRDPDPSSLQNSFKIEYLKRITEANKLFKDSFKDGWRTDRGRIYVLYGKPESIDRYPFEQDKVGYEIWSYPGLEGGVICVFGEVQPSGSGIYELIHSTIRGELRNDNWEYQLRR